MFLCTMVANLLAAMDDCSVSWSLLCTKKEKIKAFRKSKHKKILTVINHTHRERERVKNIRRVLSDEQWRKGACIRIQEVDGGSEFIYRIWKGSLNRIHSQTRLYMVEKVKTKACLWWSRTKLKNVLWNKNMHSHVFCFSFNQVIYLVLEFNLQEISLLFVLIKSFFFFNYK